MGTLVGGLRPLYLTSEKGRAPKHAATTCLQNWRQNDKMAPGGADATGAASVAKIKFLSKVWALFYTNEGPVVTEYLSYYNIIIENTPKCV